MLQYTLPTDYHQTYTLYCYAVVRMFVLVLGGEPNNTKIPVVSQRLLYCQSPSVGSHSYIWRILNTAGDPYTVQRKSLLTPSVGSLPNWTYRHYEEIWLGTVIGPGLPRYCPFPHSFYIVQVKYTFGYLVTFPTQYEVSCCNRYQSDVGEWSCR